jgi:hypothetical protein
MRLRGYLEIAKVQEIKFTYKKECPYCRTKKIDNFEYAGPVHFGPEELGASASKLKYRYFCRSSMCRGREFHASWLPEFGIIVLNKNDAQQIVKQKQCPFCKKRSVELCKGQDLTYYKYICNNKSCEYKFLKIPKFLLEKER